VLAAGLLVRLTLGGFDIPKLSGALLVALLWLGVWLVSLLLANARVAFWVGLASMLVLDLGALPPRAAVEFDDREVLYRTDQVVSVRVAPAAGESTLLVVAEPVLEGTQARFGLAADVASTYVEWSCPLRRGIQRLALPLPPVGAGALDIRLKLTGAPSRDGDYLLIYASSAQHGLLVSTAGPASVGDDVTRCMFR
jgi:hypothetical protein